MSSFFLKVVTHDGHAKYALRRFRYPLPVGDGPGPWCPTIKGPLRMCRNGYHVARPSDLLAWMTPNDRLFLVDTRGPYISGRNKVLCRSMRFLKEIKIDFDRTWSWNSRLPINFNKLLIRALVSHGVVLDRETYPSAYRHLIPKETNA